MQKNSVVGEARREIREGREKRDGEPGDERETRRKENRGKKCFAMDVDREKRREPGIVTERD